MNLRSPGALLRLAVAAGLTAYILWQADPAAVLAAVSTARWRWVAVAVALVFVDRALMAFRWLVLLRPLASASPPTLRQVLRVFFVSTFVGTFLPASIGGDAVRAVSLSRYGVAMADAAASVLVDRVLGTLSILLVATIAVWFAPPGVPAWLGPATIAVTLAAVAGVVLGLFDDRVERAAAFLLARFTRGRLLKAGSNLLESMRRYNRHGAALVNVLAGSLTVQLLRISQAWLLGMALGITAGFAAYLVYIPLILLVMLLPITISGIGTSQAAFVWLFAASGVSAHEAFALSVLFVALGTVGNLPGGVLYARGGLHGRAAQQAVR